MQRTLNLTIVACVTYALLAAATPTAAASNEATVAMHGTLTVSPGANNPSSGRAGTGVHALPLLQLRLQASDVETVLVEQVKVKISGTLDDGEHLDSLWIVEDLGERHAACIVDADVEELPARS